MASAEQGQGQSLQSIPSNLFPPVALTSEQWLWPHTLLPTAVRPWLPGLKSAQAKSQVGVQRVYLAARPLRVPSLLRGSLWGSTFQQLQLLKFQKNFFLSLHSGGIFLTSWEKTGGIARVADALSLR